MSLDIDRMNRNMDRIRANIEQEKRDLKASMVGQLIGGVLKLFWFVLQGTFIGLKLGEVVSWSWLWVLSPLWIVCVLGGRRVARGRFVVCVDLVETREVEEQ